jgi:hypothetical protein
MNVERESDPEKWVWKMDESVGLQEGQDKGGRPVGTIPR